MVAGQIRRMKIIQLNCWGGHLLNPILKFIEDEKPDIFCCQEVFRTSGELNPFFGFFQSFDKIKAAGEFTDSLYSPTWGGQAFGVHVDFGNAIFSKFQLSKPETIYIDSQYEAQQQALKFKSNIRNLQLCRVDSLNGLVVANHHGFYNQNPLGTEESLRSSQRLAARLAKVKGPLIFCGDLNLSPDSPALEPIDKLGLKNWTRDSHLSSTLSQVHDVSHKVEVACDYILSSQDIKVDSFKISDHLVSDHRALILEFSL
jgi:endonuclease/exonuclease/phosphatase family metal-dependent hydrolase